jgi:hypothetical protein
MTTAREETSRLADLLRREHHALAEFLVALSRFDAERGWESLGYRSLFDFLRRELGLSKGAAYYRMTAAQLGQRYPEVLEALREGKLCLTSIVELSKTISPENRAEILPRYFHLSKREAKEVTAAILPVDPPLRTVVTAVREVEPALALAPSPAAVVEAVETASAGWPANLVHANSVVPGGAPARSRPAQPSKVEPLTAELSRIHITVSRRLLDKLAAARDALSHSHPGASEETILEVGLDLILQRHAKRRGLVKNPRRQAPAANEPAPSSKPRTRYVPAHVRRAVWKRDEGKCQWPLDGGGICASTRRVEIDHIHGFAQGANTTAEECRLLCRVHQVVSARQLYGNDLMNRYTRPKGGSCSEPVAVYGAVADRAPTASPSIRARGRPGQARRGAVPTRTRPTERAPVGHALTHFRQREHEKWVEALSLPASCRLRPSASWAT